MLNILALLSRSKLHCFSHPSQRFGATRCNASPHNSWRNRPPHSAIEGLPADNGNYSVVVSGAQLLQRNSRFWCSVVAAKE